jgi:hypothetical protein
MTRQEGCDGELCEGRGRPDTHDDLKRRLCGNRYSAEFGGQLG